MFTFLYLRDGGSIKSTLRGRNRRLLEHITPVNQYLNADLAHRGFSLEKAILDVGPQGMKRYTALAVPLGSGDLSSRQSSRAGNLDPQSAEPQCRGHRFLHGPAEGDSALELKRDIFRPRVERRAQAF